MFGMISMQNSYYNPYQMYRAAQTQAPQQAAVYAARRAAQPETPVQPVRPSSPVSGEDTALVRLGPVIREGADPAEMAVRMRIRYDGEDEPSVPVDEDASQGVEGAQKALEEGKCETCEKRKYQDGSDDMGVSFQTPTRVDPDQAASAVRGHEMEHVVREQAKAQREDRKVVSQSVTIHTEICPECGDVYVSGGTTRTTTKANPVEEPSQADNEKRSGFEDFA